MGQPFSCNLFLSKTSGISGLGFLQAGCSLAYIQLSLVRLPMKTAYLAEINTSTTLLDAVRSILTGPLSQGTMAQRSGFGNGCSSLVTTCTGHSTGHGVDMQQEQALHEYGTIASINSFNKSYKEPLN